MKQTIIKFFSVISLVAAAPATERFITGISRSGKETGGLDPTFTFADPYINVDNYGYGFNGGNVFYNNPSPSRKVMYVSSPGYGVQDEESDIYSRRPYYRENMAVSYSGADRLYEPSFVYYPMGRNFLTGKAVVASPTTLATPPTQISSPNSLTSPMIVGVTGKDATSKSPGYNGYDTILGQYNHHYSGSHYPSTYESHSYSSYGHHYPSTYGHSYYNNHHGYPSYGTHHHY